MFYKKQKRAKQQHLREIHESRIAQEKSFDEAIQQAEQIADPSEKILALRKIEQSIGAQIDGENYKISDASYRTLIKTLNMGMGVSVAAVAIGLLVSVLVSPQALIAAPVGASGMLGSVVLSGKRSNSAGNRLKEAAQNHIERLMGQMARISQITEDTVQNNVKEISASPLYKEVRLVPGVADTFADAAASQIAADKATTEKNKIVLFQNRTSLYYEQISKPYRFIDKERHDV